MRSTTMILLLASLGMAGPAEAGVFTDNLSRCMVRNTSETDKKQLMRWMFAAMSADPSIADMAKLTPADREKLHQLTADIFSRLILVDCRADAVAALKNEGEQALGQASNVLGQAAAQQIFASPLVSGEVARFGEKVDEKKWEALGREAGLNPVGK